MPAQKPRVRWLLAAAAGGALVSLTGVVVTSAPADGRPHEGPIGEEALAALGSLLTDGAPAATTAASTGAGGLLAAPPASTPGSPHTSTADQGSGESTEAPGVPGSEPSPGTASGTTLPAPADSRPSGSAPPSTQSPRPAPVTTSPSASVGTPPTGTEAPETDPSPPVEDQKPPSPVPAASLPDEAPVEEADTSQTEERQTTPTPVQDVPRPPATASDLDPAGPADTTATSLSAPQVEVEGQGAPGKAPCPEDQD